MRQAWNARIKMVLVLNKLDRLIVKKWMEPFEIYMACSSIIEQANSFIAELIQRDKLLKEENL
jgi:translation elongation factor EF-G